MPKRITELPDTSRSPRQEAIGWTIYDSHWQVEQVDERGSVLEKIAYTNFFFAAEAAYQAALVAMPHARIIFCQRMRVIRKSWGR
jgi:hypothetical protein